MSPKFDAATRRDAASVAAICLSAFVVALAYGLALPLLPTLLERHLADSARVPLHAGLLTAAYTLPLALSAPLIGNFADCHPRKPVLAGLAGFAIATALFGIVDSLVAMYAGRLLSGLFAAAVVPVGFALASDWFPGDEARARVFAWINGAAIVGAVAGPAIGGLVGAMWRRDMPPSGAPFLLVATLAVLVGVYTIAAWPSEKGRRPRATPAGAAGWSINLAGLLLLSAITALALGIFEVGLALRAERILRLGPQQTGLMFAECMVVMFAAQLLAFNPWTPARRSRWFFAPAFALLAAGLALLAAPRTPALYVGVAAVAAAAGLLSPLIAYWVSLLAGRAQGRDLGIQAAIAGLGQTIGSLFAGVASGRSGALAFWLGAAAALVGMALAIPVSRRLRPVTGARAAPS